MKNAIFITVRTGSTRLPRKALLEINGKHTIEYVIERSKLCGVPVIMCTTVLPEDDALEAVAIKNGIFCYRGSVEDKLMRWYGAAKQHDVEFFVTADGDDLLCDPYLMMKAFEQYAEQYTDFIEGGNYLPCGAFTYGIKVSALNKVCEIKGTTETEMIRDYFVNTRLFNTEILKDVPPFYMFRNLRMTLDYADDIEFFRIIFSNVKDHQSLWNVFQFLEAHPEVKEINSHCQQRYLDNQKRITKMVLKDESV